MNIRPSVGENQKEVSRMENDILQGLNSLKTKLDPNDERTKQHIQIAQKSFEI